MRFWTWLEIKTKVEADLGIEDEDFVSADELLSYANEAIDEAESEIHKIYEDYFLSSAAVTLVSGTDEYAFPTDIYANKIREVIYRNGSTVYPVKRLRDWKKLINYSELLSQSSTSRDYEYFLVNRTAGAPKVVFTPPVLESGAYITVWYLRNANRLTVDADVCDIPEFVSFIIQKMKVRVYEKEGHPNLAKGMADLEQERLMMTSTLTDMVPDNENTIEPDLSHYYEQS